MALNRIWVFAEATDDKGYFNSQVPVNPAGNVFFYAFGGASRREGSHCWSGCSAGSPGASRCGDSKGSRSSPSRAPRARRSWPTGLRVVGP